MMCMHCKLVQPAAQACAGCSEVLARYFCSTCKFWDDTPDKNIYHCEKCGICRVGKVLINLTSIGFAGNLMKKKLISKGLDIDFFHCDKCECCIGMSSKKQHVCLERVLHSNCPICMEDMFTSRSNTIFMSCGHAMHDECWRGFTRGGNYKCPTW